MTEPPMTRDALLSRIDERWAVLQDLLARLSNVEMEKPLGDGWSAKVHLAHLAAWEKSLLGLLRGEDRGEAMGLPAGMWAGHDLERINGWLAQHANERSLDSVIVESRATHEETVRKLHSLTMDELERPYSSYQPDDAEPNSDPVVNWVHGNTWDHYNEHIGWLEAGLKG